MTSDIEQYSSLSPAVRRVANAFRVVGVISFWTQIVLAVVSTVILIFSTTVRSIGQGANAGTGAGLLFAVFGVLLLFGGAYWAFRYTQIGRQLRIKDSRTRPKRGDAVQALRLGIAINLVGMLLTLLGAQATVGVLVGKLLSQPQGAAIFDPSRATQLVQPLDVIVVQANINTILGHFVGIAASLWLARMMSRQ